MHSDKAFWESLIVQHRKHKKNEFLKKCPNLVRLPPNIKKTMPYDKKIELLEKFLMKWCSVTETERLIAIGPFGNILIDALGDKHTVPLLSEEEYLIKKLGVAMVHCHPKGDEEGKIDIISPYDIAFLYSLGIPESRVVFGTTSCVWRRGKKRIAKKIVIKKWKKF